MGQYLVHGQCVTQRSKIFLPALSDILVNLISVNPWRPAPPGKMVKFSPPPPRKNSVQQRLENKVFFCLLVFNKFKLFSNVRKVRKNHAVTKNGNNKCFSVIFKAKIFLLSSQDKISHFSWGAGSMDSLLIYCQFMKKGSELYFSAASLGSYFILEPF